MKIEDYEKKALKFIKAEAKAGSLPFKYVGASVSTNRHFTVNVYSFTDGISTMEIDSIQLYVVKGPATAQKLFKYEHARQIESKTKPIQKHEKVVEKLKEMDAYCTFCQGVIDTVCFPTEDRVDQILIKLQDKFGTLTFIKDNQDISKFDAAFTIDADTVPVDTNGNNKLYSERTIFFAVGVNV